MQSLSAIILLIAYFIVQQKTNPFYDKKLNRLEIFSISVQISVLYFGLFYLSGKNDNISDQDGFMWFVFFILLTFSILFVAIFMTYIRLEVLKNNISKQNWLFKLMSCWRIKDSQAFMDKHGLN